MAPCVSRLEQCRNSPRNRRNETTANRHLRGRLGAVSGLIALRSLGDSLALLAQTHFDLLDLGLQISILAHEEVELLRLLGIAAETVVGYVVDKTLVDRIVLGVGELDHLGHEIDRDAGADAVAVRPGEVTHIHVVQTEKTSGATGVQVLLVGLLVVEERNGEVAASVGHVVHPLEDLRGGGRVHGIGWKVECGGRRTIGEVLESLG